MPYIRCEYPGSDSHQLDRHRRLHIDIEVDRSFFPECDIERIDDLDHTVVQVPDNGTPAEFSPPVYDGITHERVWGAAPPELKLGDRATVTAMGRGSSENGQ